MGDAFMEKLHLVDHIERLLESEVKLNQRLSRQITANQIKHDQEIELLNERMAAYEQYIEKMSWEHEEERSKTILNANKVRRTAAKIAAERNEALEMVNEARQLLAIMHRDGGHHTEAVGFIQSCRDARQVYYDLRKAADD